MWWCSEPSWTHRADALAGVKAGLRPLGEVTEDLEGVSGAALVGVDPVLSYGDRAKTSLTSPPGCACAC